MTITVYSGLSGSGKTHGAVKEIIIPALKDGRKVFTNISLKIDVIENDFEELPLVFTRDDIVSDPNWFDDIFESGALFVCDEAQKIWPSGMLANKMRPEHVQFFTEHRHYLDSDGRATEIILITQNTDNICAFIRNLIEYTRRFKKLSSLGLSKNYKCHVFEGDANSKRNSRESVQQYQGAYLKRVYRYYHSHTKTSNVTNVDESLVKSGSIFRTKKTWLFFFSLLFLGYFSFSMLSSFLFDMGLSNSSDSISQESDVEKHIKDIRERERQKRDIEKSITGKFSGIKIQIASVFGNFPEVDYKFILERGKTFAEIDITELRMMGFKVEPISTCLVNIEGNGYEEFVLCKKVDRNLTDTLITPIDNTVSSN